MQSPITIPNTPGWVAEFRAFIMRGNVVSGLGQLPHLGVNALAVGRYPCIAVFHGSVMHLISEPKKAL
jgi:hypothetical protein